MRFANSLIRLSKDEEGAVTVDWVVLTAAIVGLGIGAAQIIFPGLSSTSNYISTTIETAMTANE